jgi:hypothetical protein
MGLTSVVFQDGYVPDYPWIAEALPTQKWIRGLTTLPDELMLDAWTFGRLRSIVFDGYYATVETDLADPFCS